MEVVNCPKITKCETINNTQLVFNTKRLNKFVEITNFVKTINKAVYFIVEKTMQSLNLDINETVIRLLAPQSVQVNSICDSKIYDLLPKSLTTIQLSPYFKHISRNYEK